MYAKPLLMILIEHRKERICTRLNPDFGVMLQIVTEWRQMHKFGPMTPLCELQEAKLKVSKKSFYLPRDLTLSNIERTLAENRTKRRGLHTHRTFQLSYSRISYGDSQADNQN